MVLFCYASKYLIKHKLMSDNHTQCFLHKLFDHIRWHVAAESGIQGILNFSPNAKKMPAKALLVLLPDSWKPCIFLLLVHHSYITKVRTCQSGICLKVFSFLYPFKWVTSLPCSTNPCPLNQRFWLHRFSRWHQAALSTSTDKCPWPSWNSINPAQSFPQCECTVSHVCCSWHAEQQGLLTSN